MAAAPEIDNSSGWYSLFINSVGFVCGFLIGGLSGYFGNWLWDKFKPKNTNGHLQTNTDETGTYFHGKMTENNKEQIIKTLKASSTSTATPVMIQAGTTSSPVSNLTKTSNKK
jgi:Na+/glutamate symporter